MSGVLNRNTWSRPATLPTKMNVLIQQYLWEYIVAYCLNVLSICFTSFNAIHQKNKKHHHNKRHGSTTCFRRQPSSRILWVKCNFADTTIEEQFCHFSSDYCRQQQKWQIAQQQGFETEQKCASWPDDQWPMISSKPVLSTKYLQRIYLNKIALDKLTICVQQLCWFRPRLSHCAKEI